MAEMWAKARAVYHTVVEESADPRTKDWPLILSPWGIFIIITIYNLVSWNIKKLTAGFPALSIRPVILFYNFALVLVSLYMTCELFITAYLSSYSLTCQPVDYSTHPLALRMANVLWCYYITKYVELLETAFFALRKKYNQISVLHIYHHTGAVLTGWLTLKYAPGGNSYMIAILNSFVHTVMYAYYGLSAIGPHMQRYLWWKKYMTILQLIQFFIIFAFVFNSTILLQCDFAPWLGKLILVHITNLIVLFFNFYFRSYHPSLRKATEGKTSLHNGIQKESRVNGHNGGTHGLQKAKEQ